MQEERNSRTCFIMNHSKRLLFVDREQVIDIDGVSPQTTMYVRGQIPKFLKDFEDLLAVIQNGTEVYLGRLAGYFQAVPRLIAY